MQLIIEIVIRAVEILTIVAGAAGVLVSLALLLSPNTIQAVNQALNKKILSENQLIALNATVRSEPLVLRHHVACGGVLVAGSVFILLFLFLHSLVPSGFGFFVDLSLEFSIILGKTAGITGFAAGALLFFSPAKFKALGQKVNVWIETGAVSHSLDTLSVDVDSVFIRHPFVCGLLGLTLSTALIFISVMNFLGTSTNMGGHF